MRWSGCAGHIGYGGRARLHGTGHSCGGRHRGGSLRSGSSEARDRSAGQRRTRLCTIIDTPCLTPAGSTRCTSPRPTICMPMRSRQAAASRHSDTVRKAAGARSRGLERIARIAARADVRMATAFDQRHHPAHDLIRRQIAAGDLGTVTAIRIVYCCWVDPDWSRGAGDQLARRTVPAPEAEPCSTSRRTVSIWRSSCCGEPVERLHMVLQRRVHDYAVEDGGMTIGRTTGPACCFPATRPTTGPKNCRAAVWKLPAPEA